MSSNDSEPLGQRTTSRRSRHRQDQEAQRRPPPSVEAQIDAAIARRKHQQPQSDDSQTPIVGNYEYLDHTADVQLHSWGVSLEYALEQLALAMLGYMTDLRRVEARDTRHITVRGHDCESLVFAYLQEWLEVFHETAFVASAVRIRRLDRSSWSLQAEGDGEVYDRTRHTQGTEVKAVTYSNLSIREIDGRCDIWVIVDI